MTKEELEGDGMNSFIGWIGGKKLLRNEIVNRFPEEKFKKYVEVFGGAAWVLFHKERHAEIEIYNDINSELVNLFRCIKYHCSELERELKFMLNSREMFEEFKKNYATQGMTDIQRAARFFMLIKTSYGADRKSYGCVKKDIHVMNDYLLDIEKRLSKVVIENRPFDKIIQSTDKKDTLFYLDPPYYGTEKYYNTGFSEMEHIKLSELLKELKGKFVLSYNDCFYIRQLYKDFRIEEVSRNNNLVSRYENKSNQYKELIIRNY